VKYVKEKVEKAVNNALPAKDLDLYLKWYKLDLVCIHKWLKNVKIVKARVIYLVKKESAKVA
jgi:hypothetical protein